MNIKGYLTFGLLLALTVVGTASAGQRAQKSSEEILKEEMALLVKECKLSDDQQKTISEKFKVKHDALEAWDKTNGEKMKAAQAASAAARKGTDADAKKKAGADLKTLLTERELAGAEAQKAILAVLNDEQKNALAGAQLTEATLAKYKKNSPTEAQIAKIKGACQIAAKELSAFTEDDKKSKSGRTEVNKCLKWAIDNVILTEAVAPAAVPKSASPPALPAAPAQPAAPPAAAPPAPSAPSAATAPAPEVKAPEAK